MDPKYSNSHPGFNPLRLKPEFYAVFSPIVFILFSLFIWIKLKKSLILGSVTLWDYTHAIGYGTLLAYTLCTIFCTLSFIFALKKSAKIRAAFFSILVTCLIVFGSIEIFLKIINYPPGMDNFDVVMTRSKYKRLKTLIEFQQKGIKVGPFIPPGVLRRFRDDYKINFYLTGIGNSLIIGDEEDDGLVVYPSDANGLRNPPGLYEKTDRFDVFLVGDSFTMGCWVQDGFTIADNIRKKTKLSVYNAGYGSTGLLTNLAFFIEYGLPKKPKDFILVVSEAVSLNRMVSELQDPQLKEYLDTFQSKSLIEKNSTKDRELERAVNMEHLKTLLKYEEKEAAKVKSGFSFKRLIHSSNIISLFIRNHIRWARYAGEGWPDCSGMDGHKKSVERMFRYYQQVTEVYGGKFSVVFLPDTRFYIEGYSDCEFFALRDLCQKMNIPFVDMLGAFNDTGDPKSFMADNPLPYRPKLCGHCNRKGYQLVADKIIEEILTK